MCCTVASSSIGVVQRHTFEQGMDSRETGKDLLVQGCKLMDQNGKFNFYNINPNFCKLSGLVP